MKKTTISGTSVDFPPEQKSFLMPSGYHRKLKTLSFETGKTMTEIMLDLIDAAWFEAHPTVSDAEWIESQ